MVRRCQCEACTRERRDFRRTALRGLGAGLIVAAVLALCWLVAGCSKAEQQLSTGKVIAAGQLPGICGDAAYAEVNPDCLPSLYDDFRAELSQRGLVKWDARFDCNRFAVHYISKAQTRYAVAAWQSNTPAQALALAEVWYRLPGGAGAHAIVQARTPEGDIFIEPQTGQRLPAPPESAIFLRKW
jgi:hypothetical protein